VIAIWLAGLTTIGACVPFTNELNGGLGETFDLVFDGARARLYASELSVEYIDSGRQDRVALRVTVPVAEITTDDSILLIESHGYVSLSDDQGGQLPPMVSGQLDLIEYSPDDAAWVVGKFQASFETADDIRLAVWGRFNTQLEVIDAW